MTETIQLAAAICAINLFIVLLAYGFVRLVCYLGEVPWRDERD